MKSDAQAHGEYFRTVTTVMDDLVDQPFRFKQPSKTAVSDFQKNVNIIKKVYDKFMDSVVANLEKRFPNISELESFSEVNPQYWLNDTVQFESYRTQEIQVFPSYNEERLVKYRMMKNAVAADPYLKTQSTNRVMEEVVGPLEETLPNLAKVVGVLIHASTADCERGFSALKMMKIEQRNRLSQDTLNALLMVSVEGPPTLDFPYDKAIATGADSPARRLKL